MNEQSRETTGRLRRPVAGRVVAGVAAGIAEYFEVDIALVRIIIVASVLFGGLGLPLYVAGWVLVPDEGTGISIAEDLLHGGRHVTAGEGR